MWAECKVGSLAKLDGISCDEFPRLYMKRFHQISWSIYTFYTNTFDTNTSRLAHQHLCADSLFIPTPFYSGSFVHQHLAWHKTASGVLLDKPLLHHIYIYIGIYVAESPTQFTAALPQEPPPPRWKLNVGLLKYSQDVLINHDDCQFWNKISWKWTTNYSPNQCKQYYQDGADHVHHKSLFITGSTAKLHHTCKLTPHEILCKLTESCHFPRNMQVRSIQHVFKFKES